jgi:hypothetical protein
LTKPYFDVKMRALSILLTSAGRYLKGRFDHQSKKPAFWKESTAFAAKQLNLWILNGLKGGVAHPEVC